MSECSLKPGFDQSLSTGAEVVIRRATPEDAYIIHRFVLDLAEFENSADKVQTTIEDVSKGLASQPPSFCCFLAEVAGAAVGFAWIYPRFATWAKTMHLDDLYVMEDYRRQNIASKLMQAVIQEAVHTGCSRLDWEVLAWNVDAKQFYHRIGAHNRSKWELWRMDSQAMITFLGKQSVSS